MRSIVCCRSDENLEGSDSELVWRVVPVAALPFPHHLRCPFEGRHRPRREAVGGGGGRGHPADSGVVGRSPLANRRGRRSVAPEEDRDARSRRRRAQPRSAARGGPGSARRGARRRAGSQLWLVGHQERPPGPVALLLEALPDSGVESASPSTTPGARRTTGQPAGSMTTPSGPTSTPSTTSSSTASARPDPASSAPPSPAPRHSPTRPRPTARSADRRRRARALRTTSAWPTCADSRAKAPSLPDPGAARSPSRPSSAAFSPPGTTNANRWRVPARCPCSPATATAAPDSPRSAAALPGSTPPPRSGKTRPTLRLGTASGVGALKSSVAAGRDALGSGRPSSRKSALPEAHQGGDPTPPGALSPAARTPAA
jgi:hypothetical protein